MNFQSLKAILRPLTLAFITFVSMNIRGAEITVFAAASLSDSLREVAAQFERNWGEKIILNFGEASTLPRQMEEGAPADVFFSADEAKMDALEKRGLILK